MRTLCRLFDERAEVRLLFIDARDLEAADTMAHEMSRISYAVDAYLPDGLYQRDLGTRATDPTCKQSLQVANDEPTCGDLFGEAA